MIAIEIKTGTEKVLFRCSDYSGYELCFQRLQNGVKVWTPEKFYASIGQALRGVMELKVKASDARSLAELKAAILKAHTEIVDVWHVKPDIKG
jgi:hypothetical protein